MDLCLTCGASWACEHAASIEQRVPGRFVDAIEATYADYHGPQLADGRPLRRVLDLRYRDLADFDDRFRPMNTGWRFEEPYLRRVAAQLGHGSGSGYTVAQIGQAMRAVVDPIAQQIHDAMQQAGQQLAAGWASAFQPVADALTKLAEFVAELDPATLDQHARHCGCTHPTHAPTWLWAVPIIPVPLHGLVAMGRPIRAVARAPPAMMPRC